MNKCQSCGRFFQPHPRVGKRQKCCGRAECRKKYEKKYKKTWNSKNPDYFKGRYPETKAWRDGNPGYQRAWRQKEREIQNLVSSGTQVNTGTVVVPAKVIKREIQNLVRLVRHCLCELQLTG
jgi:hypothetical protein